MLTLTRPNAAAAWPAAMSHALAYQGPERRTSGLATRLLTLMLDEIDYGVLLLAQDHRVVHANHAAQAELAGPYPLHLLGRELRADCPRDVVPLQDALRNASERGLRKLLTIGEPERRVGLSVVPLGLPGELPEHEAAILVVLGRRQVCSGLAVQAFARAHALSAGEEQVLRCLCEGLRPTEIAERNGVKIATVRTQISSARAKTGADSIRDLVQRVALLPPLVSTLRRALDASRSPAASVA